MKGNKETLISAQEKLQSNSQTEFPNFWRFSKMAQDLNREWIEFKLYKHSKHRTCQCHCDNSHGIVWSMKRPYRTPRWVNTQEPTKFEDMWRLEKLRCRFLLLDLNLFPCSWFFFFFFCCRRTQRGQIVLRVSGSFPFVSLQESRFSHQHARLKPLSWAHHICSVRD